MADTSCKSHSAPFAHGQILTCQCRKLVSECGFTDFTAFPPPEQISKVTLRQAR